MGRSVYHYSPGHSVIFGGEESRIIDGRTFVGPAATVLAISAGPAGTTFYGERGDGRWIEVIEGREALLATLADASLVAARPPRAAK